MKRILSILLIIVVLLCAAYFFLIDRLLKTAIETQGSNALTAKLDVADVTFHLFPTSIRLEGVQITNPQQPLRNVVEMRALTAPLNIGAIIDRKIDIPNMEINGLRFNTARAQSGAIANLTRAAATAADNSAATLPDINQLARQQSQTQQDELEKTRLDLTAILNRWQQQLQQLPDDNQIEAYRQRAFVLQSSNNAAGLAALRQELNNQIGSARKLFDEFTVDMQRTREQFGYARTLPQNNSTTASATPQAINNMTGALLGEQFKPLLLSITQQINQLLNAENGRALPAALLIRNIALDGQLDLGTQPLLFTGALDNLTPQPKLWNVATSFTLAGVAGQPSQFSARGAIDLRKTASVDMRFDLRQFPLQEFPLSKNPQLTVVVEHAQADIQGLLSLTGNQIDINLLSHFQQAALKVAGSGDASAQALANALRGVSDFDLNAQISGDVQRPAMKLDSSLSQRLAAALSQQLANQQPRTPNRAPPAAMSPELQQQIAGIQQLSSDFDNLLRQIMAKQAALQSIVGP